MAGYIFPAGADQPSAGSTHNLVVKSDGSLWAWGSNEGGRAGLPGEGAFPEPVRLEGDNWQLVSAGGLHTAALKTDGSLWTWGSNLNGQLGRGQSGGYGTPGRVGSASLAWRDVAAGGSHTLAVRMDGSLWTWGSNLNGQLGLAAVSNPSSPNRVGTGNDWVAVAAGEFHSLALKTDGSLWAWGSNLNGQLGIGSSAFSVNTPTQVQPGTAWVALAAGLRHSLGIRTDGSLWAWGNNLNGQLGLGAQSHDLRAPGRVGQASDWIEVTAGSMHSGGLRAGGSLWIWGNNFFGQLGLGDIDPRRVPTHVAGEWSAVAAGSHHTIALRADGVLWSAGLNSEGQLGDGSTDSRISMAPSRFGLPDLTITALSIDQAEAPGDPARVNLFLANHGSGKVPPGSQTLLAIRMAEVPEWEDAPGFDLDTFTLALNLEAGETMNILRQVDLPTAIPSGVYFFGARVNEDQAVAETDFENNLFWNPNAFPFLANLVIAELDVPAQTVERGGNLAGSVTVGNTGLGDLPADMPVTIRIRISQDFEWAGANSVELGEPFLLQGGLPAGETQAFPLALTIPDWTELGDYRVGAWVDFEGLVEEVSDEDNLRWTPGLPVRITGLSLGDALGQPDRIFNLGGDASWYGQDTVSTTEGGSAAQAPPLAAGEQAFFQTTVEGPSVVSFAWKASTSHPDNYLAFLLDGVEQARIEGQVDWQERSFLLPAGLNQARWLYARGGGSGGDTAWVENIRVEPVDKPDLVVTGMQYNPGEYVLQRDVLALTAIGKNQGTFATLPPGFRMEARLSPVRDWDHPNSVSLGYLEKWQDLDADNRFVYRATLPLPDHILAGDYFIGVYVDSTGLVDEFDETNNIGWSNQRDITISRRPDLVVKNLVYESGYFIIYPSEGEKDEMLVSFDIANEGLADLPPVPFTVNLLLTPDRAAGDENDNLLLSFEESAGLPVGQQRTYHATIEIPPGTSLGEFLYLAVQVDPENRIPEPRLGNNFVISDDPDIFVSELPVDVAVDNRGTMFEFSGVPWHGLSEDSFDGLHSARSGRTPHNGHSTFQTTVSLETPSLVSFYWKVSSEFVILESGDIKEDYLAFYIDDVEITRIAGQIDWHRVTYPLAAGERVLRWTYRKDPSRSVGADAGWVDRINYHVPDLVVETIEHTPGVYQAGDLFPVSVTIRNRGIADVPPNPQFHVQIRLSPNLFWGTEDDIVLDSFSVNGIQMDQSLAFERNIRIPENITFAENYHVAARVDVHNVIVESNELNNDRFSTLANVSLVPAVPLGVALDTEEWINDQISPSDPWWVDDRWRSGGAAPWYGLPDQELDDGSRSSHDGEDSARSGQISSGQMSWIEREIEISPTGPAEVTFWWKVSSLPNLNSLRFFISGEEQKRISGDVDWQQETFLIPAGPQILRWAYVKTNNQAVGEDAAFLDRVTINPVDKPDLHIASVQYQPGEYVLQRDRLPLQVVVQNRGAPVAGVNWEVSDVEARLSLDEIRGNADDIVLGNFARVEYLDSTDRLVFSGDLDLPLDTPEGLYYLILYVNPLGKVEEYDYDNNSFITEVREIEIRRLPNLVLHNYSYDSDPRGAALQSDDENPFFYYPLSEIRFNYTMRNAGLGDVPGGLPFYQRIQVRAAEWQKLNEDFSWVSDGILVKDLTRFSETVYMPGVSENRPAGTSINYQTSLLLPDELSLLKALDILPAEATKSTIGANHRQKLWDDYVFSLIYIVDDTNVIEESDEANAYAVQGLGRFKIRPIYLLNSGSESNPLSLEDLAKLDINEWADRHGITLDPADWQSRLLQFAFNLNPSRPPVGYQTMNLTKQDGQDHLRLTFPIVKGATDLRYIVEVSEDLSGWSALEVLQPPFLADHGPQSLSGVNGGLTSRPRILAAADQGYTALITVVDEIPNGSSGRFLRVRIVHLP